MNIRLPPRAMLMCALLFTTACESPPQPTEKVRPQPRPAQTPTFQQIAQAQNARLESLKSMYTDGVIEIRWRDREGSHFEQGNMEMWLQLPRNTALRVEKLGEVLLWLGSDDERYWIFDMIADEKTLHLGRHDQPHALDEAGALNIKPLALLDLMGLAQMPSDASVTPAVEFDGATNAWVVETAGGGGPMRWHMDTQSLLPTRIESLSETGETLLISTLKRYESVNVKGMSAAGLPKMAELIDIASPPGSSAKQSGTGEVKIVIDQADGPVDSEQSAKVFDVNRLMKSLRPDRVESDIPAQAAAPAGP